MTAEPSNDASRIDALEQKIELQRQALKEILSILEKLNAGDSSLGMPTTTHGMFLQGDIDRVRRALE